jgi:hypothetical protein
LTRTMKINERCNATTHVQDATWLRASMIQQRRHAHEVVFRIWRICIVFSIFPPSWIVKLPLLHPVQPLHNSITCADMQTVSTFASIKTCLMSHGILGGEAHCHYNNNGISLARQQTVNSRNGISSKIFRVLGFRNVPISSSID